MASEAKGTTNEEEKTTTPVTPSMSSYSAAQQQPQQQQWRNPQTMTTTSTPNDSNSTFSRSPPPIAIPPPNAIQIPSSASSSRSSAVVAPSPLGEEPSSSRSSFQTPNPYSVSSKQNYYTAQTCHTPRSPTPTNYSTGTNNGSTTSGGSMNWTNNVGSPHASSYHSSAVQSPHSTMSYHSSTSSTNQSSSSSMTSPTSHLKHRTFFRDARTVQSPDVTRPYNEATAIDKGHSSTSHTITQNPYRKRGIVKRLDVFPKLERDMVVSSDQGGLLSMITYSIIFILVISELLAWRSQNKSFREHIVVETALGKKMIINLNITFPALACEDLHVDVMDVAGDSQLDVDDTFTKTSLHGTLGTPSGRAEVFTSTERARQREEIKRNALMNGLSPTYCGTCYGAEEYEGQCCNTCEDVKAAYKKKRWDPSSLLQTSEQCIREGQEITGIKPIKKGEGCNIAGYMSVSRVAGNFHIAMGEGVDRDGIHIHKFNAEDAPNFNVTHIIHELSFGPKVGSYSNKEKGGYINKQDEPTKGLGGIMKVTTEDNGTTGLFQYFLKVVPTYHKGHASLNDHSEALETHQLFVTERFRPLMTSSKDEDEAAEGADAGGISGSGMHGHYKHHQIQNSILPGVFFIYDIYPFAVEVSKNEVPTTHLLIRLLALVGGVLSVANLASSLVIKILPKKRHDGNNFNTKKNATFQ